MVHRLRLISRHLSWLLAKPTSRATMATFHLPNASPSVTIHLTPDLSQDQLLSFPAFKTWISTLQRSLSLQKNKDHTFNSAPYQLRKIDIQSVDFFGGGRIGFIKLKAEVSNDNGEKLPGSVFLRGGSVGMMVYNSLSHPDAPLAPFAPQNGKLTRPLPTADPPTGRCPSKLRNRQTSHPHSPTPHPCRLALLPRTPSRHARRQRHLLRRRRQRNPRGDRPVNPRIRAHQPHSSGTFPITLLCQR